MEMTVFRLTLMAKMFQNFTCDGISVHYKECHQIEDIVSFDKVYQSITFSRLYLPAHNLLRSFSELAGLGALVYYYNEKVYRSYAI
jgi:hypothetical protein